MRDLDAAFAALHGQVAESIEVPAEQGIIVRGRRHVRSRGGAVGMLVLALIGGGYAMLAAPGNNMLITEPQIGKTTASASGPEPVISPFAPSRTVQSTVARDIPTGFLLHEAEGWKHLDEQPPTATICGEPSTQPTTMVAPRYSRTLAISERVESLSLYLDDQNAGVAFRAIRTALDRCTGRTTTTVKLGDDALLVAPGRTGWSLIVLRGLAIAVYIASDRSLVERDASQMARRMCRYAKVCRPATGFPATQGWQSQEGTSWATVLAISDRSPTDRRLGAAIAQASEVGYRAALGTPDCDYGAREQLELGHVKPYWYVVIYFATRELSKQFQALYGPPVLFMALVRTYCRQ